VDAVSELNGHRVEATERARPVGEGARPSGNLSASSGPNMSEYGEGRGVEWGWT
jgi:hypothetical protein